MSYDPDLRRDTPLARKLKERIRREGPISVRDYVTTCYYDDEHGYYRNRTVIGGAGDFVTAPEISQAFGELVGLWCIAVWQQMGSPARFHLVEFGPGRGTMMRDMLRAQKLVPAFLKAAVVTLDEQSVALREIQKITLADAPVPIRWRHHTNLADFEIELPSQGKRVRTDTPVIVIGNEVLDVEVPDQYVRRKDGWHERQVSLNNEGELIFSEAPAPFAKGEEPLRQDKSWTWGETFWSRVSDTASDGDIVEFGFWHQSTRLAKIATTSAGLYFDYGHERIGFGDTLQAVRNHRAEHPLTSPGEADLTCQVDFEQFVSLLRDISDRVVDGPITQAEFLGRLGIIERASKLMGANPAKAGEIEAGVMRLMAPNGMGTRFKVIGIRSPNVAKLPGF